MKCTLVSTVDNISNIHMYREILVQTYMLDARGMKSELYTIYTCGISRPPMIGGGAPIVELIAHIHPLRSILKPISGVAAPIFGAVIYLRHIHVGHWIE